MHLKTISWRIKFLGLNTIFFAPIYLYFSRLNVGTTGMIKMTSYRSLLKNNVTKSIRKDEKRSTGSEWFLREAKIRSDTRWDGETTSKWPKIPHLPLLINIGERFKILSTKNDQQNFVKGRKVKEIAKNTNIMLNFNAALSGLFFTYAYQMT